MDSLKQPPSCLCNCYFYSTNFSFSCPNCLSIKPRTCHHKLPTSNTNTKTASVISECNTKSESHTTSPSPLALLYSISLTPKLLNIKTSPPRISVNPNTSYSTPYYYSSPTTFQPQINQVMSTYC